MNLFCFLRRAVIVLLILFLLSLVLPRDLFAASALTNNQQELKSVRPMIQMHRVAQPEEIAPAFLFLA